MPEQQHPDEPVPVHFVAYENDADLDIDNSGEDPSIANHDELVNSGQTFDEIRAMKRSAAEEYDLDVVRPGDPLWDDRLEDMELGDAFRLDELLD
jgi:hypothetical protein